MATSVDRAAILRRRARFVAAALAPLGVAAGSSGGCGDDAAVAASGGGGADGGPSTTSTSTSSTTSSWSTSGGGARPCLTTTPPPYDETTSCADAANIWPDQTTGIIDPPDDADYYRFDGSKGSWFIINVDEQGGELDPILTLYDGVGSVQLASNDDAAWWGRPWGYPRGSLLYYRLPATGDYCVEVRDVYPAELPADSFHYYWVSASNPTPSVLVHHGHEQEPNDDHASAELPTTKPIRFGTLSYGTDVDVYKLDAPAGAPHAFISLWPSGPTGSGSTKGPGIVRLVDEDNSLVARIDYQLGARHFGAVPVDPGKSYYLEITRPDTMPGENDFYAFSWLFEDQIGPEVDNGKNDLPAGADAMKGVFYGTIPPGDVDWLAISNVSADQPIWLFCASARVGSGVADFTVSLFENPNGPPLQAEQESEAKDLQWVDSPKWVASMPPPKAVTSGIHYLKVESSAAIEGGPSSYHYLCFAYPQQP